MRVLLACEESQAVTIAMRALGIEAFSCDLKPCSGGHPEWHYQDDCFEIIDLYHWDIVIAFPPCTYLTVSSNRWYRDQPARKSGKLVGAERRQAREEAIEFFLKFTRLKCRWMIENPIGVMSVIFRRPNQIIQPWMFGHRETKATCLWSNGLPKLKPTDIVEPEFIIDRNGKKYSPIHFMSFKNKKTDRSELRSKTYSGIGEAMASQLTVPFKSETQLQLYA